MDKFLEIPTAEELKAAASELKSKVPESAQEYFDQVTGSVKNVKVVKDLATDVKENPAKVGCEAGLSALAGAAVFAGLRLYDSYVASKDKEPKKPSSLESPSFEPYAFGSGTLAEDAKDM